MFKMKYNGKGQCSLSQMLICFMLPTQIEKDQYTLIEQSTHLVLLKMAFINTRQL